MTLKPLAFLAFATLSQISYAAAPPATPIPEPGILSLFAIGISCLALLKKRK